MPSDDYKDDLRDVRDSLQREIREGFDGVHSRLDTLNGRVGRGEVAAGTHDVRLTNLEREVFRRRRGDGSDGDDALARKSIAGRAVTDRDVRIVWMTLAALVGAVEVAFRVVPVVVRMFRP